MASQPDTLQTPNSLERSSDVPRRNEEKTLGEKAPGTPFALVALGYFAALALTCGVVAAMVWLA